MDRDLIVQQWERRQPVDDAGIGYRFELFKLIEEIEAEFA
jgi:hypothetical protein